MAAPTRCSVRRARKITCANWRALLDTEVLRVKQSVGNVGDIRLLVMSGLMVADRLSEAIRRIEALEEDLRELTGARAAVEASSSALEKKVSERLATAAQRLEAAAKELG